jgi:hypothetical protein
MEGEIALFRPSILTLLACPIPSAPSIHNEFLAGASIIKGELSVRKKISGADSIQ